MKDLIIYKSVFDRSEAITFSPEIFFTQPLDIFEAFKIDSPVANAEAIAVQEDKQLRNNMKRDLLPAASFGVANILTIDIDDIAKDYYKKKEVVQRLVDQGQALAVQESISGNVVAFYKFDCSIEDFPFLYYKIYLELTLLLGVNIDFLPDFGRLRYVNPIAETYLYNPDAPALTETLKVGKLPAINTQVGIQGARNVIYRSN